TKKWFGLQYPCHLQNLTVSVIASYIPGFLYGNYPTVIDLVVDQDRDLLYALYDNNDVQAWRITETAGSDLEDIGTVKGYTLAAECKQSRNEELSIASLNTTPPQPPRGSYMAKSSTPSHTQALAPTQSYTNAHTYAHTHTHTHPQPQPLPQNNPGSTGTGDSIDLILVTTEGRRLYLTATPKYTHTNTHAYIHTHTPARHTLARTHRDTDSHADTHAHEPLNRHPYAHTSTNTATPRGYENMTQNSLSDLQSDPLSTSFGAKVRYTRLSLLRYSVSAPPSSATLCVAMAYCSPGAFLIDTNADQLDAGDGVTASRSANQNASRSDMNSGMSGNAWEDDDVAELTAPKGALLCMGNEYLNGHFGTGNEFQE
ncbi:hypothetical protein SARC_12579, partial [Sphaeroforma arctica JP610]